MAAASACTGITACGAGVGQRAITRRALSVPSRTRHVASRSGPRAGLWRAAKQPRPAGKAPNQGVLGAGGHHSRTQSPMSVMGAKSCTPSAVALTIICGTRQRAEHAQHAAVAGPTSWHRGEPRRPPPPPVLRALVPGCAAPLPCQKKSSTAATGQALLERVLMAHQGDQPARGQQLLVSTVAASAAAVRLLKGRVKTHQGVQAARGQQLLVSGGQRRGGPAPQRRQARRRQLARTVRHAGRELRAPPPPPLPRFGPRTRGLAARV